MCMQKVCDKEEIVNLLIMDIGKEWDCEKINEFKNSFRRIFFQKDIIEKETSISVVSDSDYNEKIIKNFVVDKTVERLAENTIKHYVVETKKFLEFTDKNFRNVTYEDIIYYLAVIEKGKADITVNNTRKYIKAFFTWCVEKEYLLRNPFDRIKPMKLPEKHNDLLSDSELEILRDACITKRELALIDFCASTGVRVSEITSLNINNINFASGQVKIYAQKTRTWRTVFLDTKALKHLTDYRMELNEQNICSDGVFLSKRRKNGFFQPLKNSSIELILKKVLKRTHIKKDITVHTFRKYFASKMYRNGMKPDNIAKILGHKNFSTTSKFYVIISNEDLKVEFDRCSH